VALSPGSNLARARAVGEDFRCEAPTVSRNPAPARNFKCWGKEIRRGDQARGCAVSRDIREIRREITQAASWAAKWRKLAEEALEVASAMGDLEARRQMLFISEDYRLLAECAKECRERLVAYAAAVKRGPC
jgi:hypothetical protein